MGVILDSSVVIAGERQKLSAADTLSRLRDILGPEPVALSVISVIELEHGIWRATNPAQAMRRRAFFSELFSSVPIYPLTIEIARRTAQMQAESQQRGSAIPFQDLIIGVTALQFDYSVATHNLKHFQIIPGLVVKQI